MSALMAGPSRTFPLAENRDPCSGQPQLFSASFQRRAPPNPATSHARRSGTHLWLVPIRGDADTSRGHAMVVDGYR